MHIPDIAVLTSNDVLRVKQAARESATGRARICLHREPGALPHEMLIAWWSGTPFPPHRSAALKFKSHQIIEGALHYFVFSDNGSTWRYTKLCTEGPDHSFMVRLPPRAWHMPVPVEPCAVYLETYTGPYERSADVEFAPWAPGENDPGALARYTDQLLTEARANLRH